MSNTCPGLRICLNLRKNFSPCPPPDLQFTNTIMGDPGRDSATCHPFLPIEVERKKLFWACSVSTTLIGKLPTFSSTFQKLFSEHY